MSYKGGITSHPGKGKTMTERKMLWYAVRGARDYFISLGEDTRKAEGEVKKNLFFNAPPNKKRIERT